MKKLVLSALALAVALPAAAQQAAPAAPRGETTRAELETRVRERFAKADGDRDGFVTKAELAARRGERREDRREAQFARLDADKNGSISRAEFLAQGDARGERRGRAAGRRAMRPAMMARFGGRMFDVADADRDQRVSQAEAVAVAVKAFERADANRDGRVTREERRAAVRAFRTQRS